MTLRSALVSVFMTAFSALPAHAEDWIGAQLAEWGNTASSGAAAGYVPDALCAECHADKTESFAKVGMGKSFYRPSKDKVIERFDDNPFYHAPSQRYYRMSRSGDDYLFRRWRLSESGAETDFFEAKVDWILGSGHHSRIYLVQSPNGAMIQLPLAWYAQDGGFWEMAPGYEFENHPGLTRAVPKRCMSCHNAFPDVPEGSDRIGMPDIFPVDLPEGIGCQRCHGPGAEHAALAISGSGTVPDIRRAIVHPGKLPFEQTYGICYGCHMQPSVAIASPLVPGRGAYSFRPGELLETYKTVMDVTDSDLDKNDRFDINHHPYRLEQSTCFTASADRGKERLGCLSCHDPHVKVKPEDRAQHYRTACLSCHATDAAGQPVMSGANMHPEITVNDDCTVCHMPLRRTRDVIHVKMTDHKISRDPGDLAELITPIEKRPPNLTEVFPMIKRDPPGQYELVQTLRSVLSHPGTPPEWATDGLGSALVQAGVTEPGPWIELSRSLMQRNAPADARFAAMRALSSDPDNPRALSLLATADFRLGDAARAVGNLQSASQIWPENVEIAYNLGVVLRATGDLAAALATARNAVELDPMHWPSYRLIGDISVELDSEADAIDAYLKALSIQPDAARIRAPLIELLQKAGRPEEAARLRRP